MRSDFYLNSESLDAIRYFFQRQIKKILARERGKRSKIGNRTNFNINRTCGLDARVLSTLLLRASPLTRQVVRAAFCVVHLEIRYSFNW